MEKSLGEKSKIPITWLLAIVSSVVMVVMYASRIDAKAEIARQEAIGHADYLRSIDQRLSRIEGVLETIKERRR